MGSIIMFKLFNMANKKKKAEDGAKDAKIKKVKTPVMAEPLESTESVETKKDKVVVLATVETAAGYENQHFIESEEGDYPNGFQRDNFGLLKDKKYKIVTDTELKQLNK